MTEDGSRSRRVWVWSDAHIGLDGPNNDNRDGWEWLDLAVKDVRENLLPLDFVLSLGDLTNKGTDEQLSKYVEVREHAGFGPWYEMAGNHDYWAFHRGSWQQHVSLPQHAVLLDGNMAWILCSVELDGAAGRLSRKTFNWLKETIYQHKDRNVIVCTHQPIHDSVANSRKEWRSLFVYEDTGKPYELGHITEEQFREVERMLDEVRADLWLCCHAHSGPRTAQWCVKKGRTTVMNVASICHAYGTQASRSFVMEFKAGARTIEAKSRNHDKGAFEPEFTVAVPLPHPVELSGAGKWTIG